VVAVALIRAARPSTERIALYAGLAALALVALADFSWHIPATQVVLALYVGTLLRSGAGGREDRALSAGNPVPPEAKSPAGRGCIVPHASPGRLGRVKEG